MNTPYINYLISEIRQVTTWNWEIHESRVAMYHIVQILECGVRSVGLEELGPIVHALLTVEQRLNAGATMAGLFNDLKVGGIYLYMPPTTKECIIKTLYKNKALAHSLLNIQKSTLPSLVSQVLRHDKGEVKSTVSSAWVLYHVFPHIPITEHFTQRLAHKLQALQHTTHPHHGWYEALVKGEVTSEEVASLLKLMEKEINVPPRKKKGE